MLCAVGFFLLRDVPAAAEAALIVADEFESIESRARETASADVAELLGVEGHLPRFELVRELLFQRRCLGELLEWFNCEYRLEKASLEAMHKELLSLVGARQLATETAIRISGAGRAAAMAVLMEELRGVCGAAEAEAFYASRFPDDDMRLVAKPVEEEVLSRRSPN